MTLRSPMGPLLSVALLAAIPAIAETAETFDGTKPMVCEALQGHDCVPTATTCNHLKPKEGQDMNLHIDVAKKTVRSPYRTSLLPIRETSKNKESLVLQGTTLQLVWSATVHRTTGRFTIAIADREGAYVVFGQCKLADAGSAAISGATKNASSTP